MPRAHEGADYTTDDIVRIRRGLEQYKKSRDIEGWPTVCIKINRYYRGQNVTSTTKPLNLRTLSRFMTGSKVRPVTLRLLEEFIEDKAPIDNVTMLGDAAAALFGERWGNLLVPPPLDIALSKNFVRSYGVFLEGRALTPNPALGKPQIIGGKTYRDEHFVPKYPDREYVFDTPFEIPYSRIDLTTVEWSGFLQVQEKIKNAKMSRIDRQWKGGDDADAHGILTVANIFDQYILVLQNVRSKRAKLYMVEPDTNTWTQPREQRCYVGAVMAHAGDGYVSSIGAKRVMFVPVGERLANPPPS